MPISLRISPKKGEVIKKAAMKARKTKTAYILETVDEKLGLIKNREQTIRDFAGWLSHDEAEELGTSLEIFNKVNEGEWD